MNSNSEIRRFHSPSNKKVITVGSRQCAYCGVLFRVEIASTIDHVVGRKFVPKGQLAGQWNLLLNACRECNGDKADLEDDISVISMMSGMNLRIPTDPLIIAEIKRKSGRAVSRRTGKVVARSRETLVIDSKAAGRMMSLRFNGPPQIDYHRIERLAWYHVQAFVFFIGYNKKLRTGRYIVEGFQLVTWAGESNWGNVEMRWFENLTTSWRSILRADAAGGYFRIVLRQIDNEDLWSWALEWNKSLRVVGFFGNRQKVEEVTKAIPRAAPVFTHTEGNEKIVCREEIRLPKDEDFLFDWKDFMNPSEC